jgi:tetratricopeptide (TPR) repeat protein
MSAPRLRLVVTRGDRYDVAEWSPGEPTWIGAARGGPEGPSSVRVALSVIAALIAVVGVALFLHGQAPPVPRALVATVADLQAVHAGVSTRGEAVRRAERLVGGDVVETDDAGRARLRLDDGTVVVIDRSTRLAVRAGGLELLAGRVFLQGAPGARTTVDLGGGSVVVSGADLGVSRTAAESRVYVARAEVTVRAAAGGAETTVRAGDTARLSGGAVAVAPERGYDDWTGGLAAPWTVSGAPRRAVGELWGRAAGAEAGSPLTLRAHDVQARVTRELAETEARTTFFNGGSDAVIGDFRLALPPGAIVSRFAVIRGENVIEGRVALASRRPGGAGPGGHALEWAGEGWVRGHLPTIAAGEVVTVVVGYTEWLSPRPKGDGKNLVVEYRYPMVGDGAPPLVGEFSARVDVAPSTPVSLAAGLGARVDATAVELRRADFRPTADLVVDVEIEPWKVAPEARGVMPARLYAAPPSGDDEAGSLVVRAELTPRVAVPEGVTLALVLDASASTEPALLDAERALVEAVLAGLGPRDRVVVLAADQTARPVGPKAIGPLDAARRKEIVAALGAVVPGGATDLGRALEAGADALPADAPAGMVIYVGDGWPTVGDTSVDQIHARLARRPGGAPRVGAVAVGPLANRFELAALARGSGPMLEIADPADAARAAIELCADALRPTLAGVELDLGPEVERVYPRGARAVVAGDTVSAVGRFRGDFPREVTLRFRDAAGVHEERRPVVVEPAGSEADVTRRWAAARVEEIALSGRGREAATDVALRAGLLTPWTGWVAGMGDGYNPTRLDTRILDLAVGREVGFSAAFATPRAAAGALSGVIHETEDEGAVDDKEDALKGPVAIAAARVVEGAGAAVRACRDSRAALRPELYGSLEVALELDGDGHALGVKVKGSAGADDDALDRCVEGVVLGLAFPASGLKVKIAVHHVLDLPPAQAGGRGRRCSPTSALPMPLRRGVWRERLDRGAVAAVYTDAKRACELPTWTDKRALLELILLQVEDGLARVSAARDLDRAGEADAAALLRREAVRRARSADELRAVRHALLGDERYPVGLFRKQYGAVADDAARLSVVRRYLSLAPHDARLRRRLFALLESLGKKVELADEVRLVRRDPFADAGLLADGASALRRIGDEPESRRAFGELAERAPGDPWARAFLGDRLRNEGWFDEAQAAYAALDQLLPGDPAGALRLALAHAGAGRLDLAERTLSRVAQTGGRAGDARLGDLAGRLALTLLAEASARPGLAPAELEQLTRASLELPRPPGATLIVLRAPAGAYAVEARLLRGPRDAREERAPEVAAEGIGLYALRLDPGDGSSAVLRLRRPAELAPARATKVRVDALVPDGDGKPPKRVSTEVELPISGKAVEIAWSGSAWGS